MKAEIITLLRQRGTYVSGQEICGQFHVSRTAVWKAIEQLKKEGYHIEAVQNKGYLLVEEDREDIFNQVELESRLNTQWIGSQLHFHETLDSTNVRAKTLAEQGAPHGTLVVANEQTAGRGRRGRAWESPGGTNIYYTLLLRPEIPPGKASMLTLVMAMAIVRGVEECCGTGAGIKWPNDIVVDGRKACGILTEMSLSVEQNTIDYVVIGVGVNAKLQQFPGELRGHAISLEEKYGHIHRCVLTAAIMKYFESYYSLFLETESLEKLQEQYNAMLLNCDRQVRVLDPKGEFEGIARGISPTGELIVELPEGGEKYIYAGEVSVRGVYGYV